ncbi:MAG: winged helix-turn-helix transcriptional regulator [Alphaproteobacteria bacterium]|nr:winged helix-turn-helix transcriptional regulator [Rhodospirillaceae bacterium]MDG2479287.1 winged helix-turn-helix transcriptional regulator [Alphaproteobacteria bacterium]MBT6205355.1 winged helix-turn-helix transcriptional regulator [Rhodospirillaceae bacterium]MBT6512055.1 winged helix-turn-helix transcriptional regulator [Rhodospirillaceae bacterium]MBT7611862.1 winged helix-turn-helix transcriptional regulator [Rhodospirillaceae bacterium]
MSTRREATEEQAIRQILDRIEVDDEISQRDLADELGVALGMVNAYMKRCVRTGLIKIQQAPRRRYKYYLTPQGFAEKSRLTAQYLRDSFGALRRGLSSFDRLYADLEANGVKRIVLCGDDEMLEMGILGVLSTEIEVVAVFNPLGPSHEVRGVPAADPANPPEVDRWVLAVLKNGNEALDALREVVDDRLIAMPDVLRLSLLLGVKERA